MADEAGPPQKDRFVGIFYFLWHNNTGGRSPHWDGPYDIGKILEADPGALSNPASPFWGPVGMYHYWGKPMYGYYLSTDPWVLRRHAQILADAGVDTLIFDTTNALTYREVYLKLCEVFDAVRREDGRVPQLCFMVNTEAGRTARKIYEEFYQPGLHRELWFHWEGKPLMICDPEKADPKLRDFFTLRRAHWPFVMENTQRAWHWEAAYPQPYGYTDNPSVPEQVNVSVAQNLRMSDGKVTNMSSGEARGRNFHDRARDTSPGAVNHGYNFAEQWQRAFELDPPFVMITGWNEWIAGRWGKPDGPLVFVDQFDEEHSRDIEPVNGLHNDNYLWQMLAGIRRYKGTAPLPFASTAKTIDLDGGFEQWQEVRPVFRDHQHETDPRDFDGAGGTHYRNDTGRNDIVACRVARDKRSVYFQVETREPLSLPSDPNWMWLLIDADQDVTTGWEGYEFIVNRQPPSATQTTLERHVRDWEWEPVGEVPLRNQGNRLHLAIPRTALNLPIDTTRTALDFKWLDHATRPGDPMDVYVSGDAAPEGRFRYCYQAK
ncbi:MAG: hypothetical protein H7A46_02765 [Verrucomicrobiales bacterium]|nr:hypothetical protein [Verrucomicrobiales bacterium]